jgi:acetylornithine/N-succinyldiaminopimelate aminotransferase
MTSPILPVYKRAKLAFSHGQGAYLYTTDGDKYLDFASGIAVNALGHSHPVLIQALTEQASKLWHVSNLYEIPEMNKFATLLTECCFADSVFFTNSGTEAVECAIKMTRKYFDVIGEGNRFKVITFSGAYHGRTLAALSASDRPQCQVGFHPLVEGFYSVEFGNIAAVEAAICKDTAAILIEPIQGEGGVKIAPSEFMQALRKLADNYGLLLIVDEVQCGVGRSGKFSAYEYSNITPDIMLIAKGIANGFPLGACLTTKKIANAMTEGSHGSTFGGNPLAMAVGFACVNIIRQASLLTSISSLGDELKTRLEVLMSKFPHVIEDVRGRGFMLGIKTKLPCKEVIEKLRQFRLLTAPAGNNVIKIYPPFIVNQSHLDEALQIMEQCFASL